MKNFLIMLLVLGLVSCTSHWEHPYGIVAPTFELPAESGQFVVVTRDLRPHVTAQLESKALVGKVKSITKDSYPIYTVDNRNFGELVGKAICNGFAGKGIGCSYEETDSELSDSDKKELIAAKGADRLLVLDITQWYIDVFALPDLRYGFSLGVYNQLGHLIGTFNTAGEETLGVKEYFNPAQNASITAPESLKNILEQLFSSEKMMEALNVQFL